MNNSNKPPATSKRLPPEYRPFKSMESTCGEIDESQDVESYDGKLGVSQEFVTNHQSSVGQLQWNDNLAQQYTNPGNVSGERWCSGTLISEDLFLTAGHCLDPVSEPGGWMVPRINGTDDPIQPEEIVKNMHVNFNFQYDPNGVLREETTYRMLELIEYRLGKLDYAIVRLEGKPGKKFGVADVSEADANLGDQLCIIGHPLGKPKKIEAGECSDFDEDRIGYNTLDTQGGNSGSGVLRAMKGDIVGVHTQGGCDSRGYNSGHRISTLINTSKTIANIVNKNI